MQSQECERRADRQALRKKLTSRSRYLSLSPRSAASLRIAPRLFKRITHVAYIILPDVKCQGNSQPCRARRHGWRPDSADIEAASLQCRGEPHRTRIVANNIWNDLRIRRTRAPAHDDLPMRE